MDNVTPHIDDTTYCVRRMSRKDLDVAVDWAAAEGWNPGLHDADIFWETDPKGYFIGELDGEPVGVVSAVAYDASFGFGGFFIVAAHLRHHGYGIPLFHAGMRYLGNRNIGLDGVFTQQENYAKAGFQFAYRNLRFEGIGGGTCPDGVVPVSSLPFEQMFEFDSRFFPAKRERFLRGWLATPDSTGFAVVEAGALKGYGVVRACRTGSKIGPLFAENAEAADTIYRALAAHAPEGPLYLDIPEPNGAAVELVNRHGMREVFGTARMYTQGAPELPIEGIFGITSFELG